MTERTFRFGFSVSREFLTKSPSAEAWIAAMQDQIARQKAIEGPRGGLYRLTTPPDEWRTTEDDEPYFMRNQRAFQTRRKGRYVRPDRITPDLRLSDFTLDTVTLPVQEGLAVLPDGRTVETPSQFVVVPVPPR